MAGPSSGSLTVWFVTTASAISYLFLVVPSLVWRSPSHVSFDRHVVVLTALLILGAVVALLVRRMQLLGHYCRRLPTA